MVQKHMMVKALLRNGALSLILSACSGLSGHFSLESSTMKLSWTPVHCVLDDHHDEAHSVPSIALLSKTGPRVLLTKDADQAPLILVKLRDEARVLQFSKADCEVLDVEVGQSAYATVPYLNGQVKMSCRRRDGSLWTGDVTFKNCHSSHDWSYVFD